MFSRDYFLYLVELTAIAGLMRERLCMDHLFLNSCEPRSLCLSASGMYRVLRVWRNVNGFGVIR